MTTVFRTGSTGLVELSLNGLAKCYGPIIQIHEDPLFVRARSVSQMRRVALVSGGGSGHEPMHAGFVGQGMLDAAVPGRIFASPHNRQIFEASMSAALPGGVIHIVKNYTGDKINFGIAAERLRARGVPVGRVLVDDDVATDRVEVESGRRGTAATVIVEKILGGAADSGLGLDDLVAVGSRVVQSSRSLAVAARAQTRLDTGQPAFSIEHDRLEFGVGIHGERATTTVASGRLEELVDSMITRILDSAPPGDVVIVLVNNLGGMSNLELYAIFDAVESDLLKRGKSIAASLVGAYCTALDMKGFSLTITVLCDSWIRWFQAPALTPGWIQR